MIYGSDVQYVVKDNVSGNIIYRGTEDACIKYLDDNPVLWIVCGVYSIYPGDDEFDTELAATTVVEKNLDNEWEDS